MTTPRSASRRHAASKPIRPSATITLIRVRAAASATRCGWQAAISSARWLVVRRRAADCRGDIRVGQLNPSSDRCDVGILAKPGLVHRAHQEVSRAITGEYAPGSIGAVGGRRQAEHQQRARRIAESREPACPSTMSSRCAAFLSRGDPLAVSAQPRAPRAGGDAGGDRQRGNPPARAARPIVARAATAPANACTCSCAW